jgi:hypothetical protein
MSTVLRSRLVVLGAGDGEMSIVAGIFLFVGSMFVLLAGILALRVRGLLRRGVRTEGVIVDLIPRTSRYPNDDDVTYAPQVRFTDRNGQAHLVTSSTSSNPPGFNKGDVVLLLYDPLRPEAFLIDTFGQKWILPLILGGMGLLFLAIGTIVLNWPSLT